MLFFLCWFLNVVEHRTVAFLLLPRFKKVIHWEILLESLQS
jgi:hypothetical protein